MIPIILLWKVKIKRNTKILLGVSLCISLCMIVVAFVRMSGLRIRGTNIDIQWQMFWSDVETNIAVIMVSITAVRSLLGLKAMKARKKKEHAWYAHCRKLLFRQEQNDLDENQLPYIPRATLTGIRAFIRGNRNSDLMISKSHQLSSRDDMTETEQHIIVSQRISESENVRSPPEASLNHAINASSC